MVLAAFAKKIGSDETKRVEFIKCLGEMNALT